MAASVPWSVSAVDPEAWETARDAARRSGVSVGEWLESAIRDSAHETMRAQRSPSHDMSRAVERRLEDLAERLDHLAQRAEQSAPASRHSNSDFALLASIDALNNRVEALTRDVQRGVAPAIERKTDDISHAIEILSRRLDRHESLRAEEPRTPGEEPDAAVAEIMMRQSALDGVPPSREPRRNQEGPGLDLGHFENQLKVLTDGIQAMRRVAAEAESTEILRRELGTIARQHREREASTAQRLDRTGGGRSDETGGEVVQALDDIRSVLAEVRSDKGFASVERDLREVSNKLDHLLDRGADTGLVTRLREQTDEIRGLLSSALPSEVLKAMVERIDILVRTFEKGFAGADQALRDAMAGIDLRIETLSERIDGASRRAQAHGAFDDIRARLDELQSVVVNVGQGPSKSIDAALHALAEKLDATECRLADTIERGFLDVLGQLQELRSNAGDSGLRSIESALRAIMEKLDATESRLGNLGALERDLHDVYGLLQQLHMTPDEVGARPAHEADMPKGADTADPGRRASGGIERKRLTAEVDPAWSRPAPTIKAEPPMPTAIRPLSVSDVDTDLDDMPLEPGSGAPRMRVQSAALRVAQSEAALSGLGTSSPPAPSRTSDFIAAARRAAQAAGAEPVRESSKNVQPGAASSIIAKAGGLRRLLLLGLATLLLILAAMRFFDGGLAKLFVMDQSVVAPKVAEIVPNIVETASATEDRSSPVEPTGSLAGAPPAGLLSDGREVAFLGDNSIDPATTGATAAKPARNQIQTASAPPPTGDAPDLPAALGTPALRAAASAGDPLASYEIGARYLEGRGVRADPTEAIEWLERALAKGSAPAAYRLGNIYEKGHGVAKNGAEAMRYYMLGAEAGNVKAMHNLAVMHAEGPDGKPDYRTAARWFRTAAERGLRDSQYNLGVLYARGLGVEQNLTESFRWFSLAANQGDSDASRKRDDVGKRLDVQTLVAAKLAVQTWNALTPDAAANDVQLKPEWDTADGQPRKRSVKK